MAVVLSFQVPEQRSEVLSSMPNELRDSYMIPKILDDLDAIAASQGLVTIGSLIRPDEDLLDEVEDAIESGIAPLDTDESQDVLQSIAHARSLQGQWFEP